MLGLTFAGLLFVVFFMSSQALPDRDLEGWMLSQTQPPTAAVKLSLDHHVLPVAKSLIAGQALEQWSIELPNSRVPPQRLQTWVHIALPLVG